MKKIDEFTKDIDNVGRMIDGVNGFIFGLNFSYKDTTYVLAVDEDGTMAYEESKSEEVYSKYMYSDFFANPSAHFNYSCYFRIRWNKSIFNL